MTDRTDTAHRYWDARWTSAQGRDDWLVPDATVAACAERLWSEGARRVLDLGCGVGRHALMLAEMGYAVTALDGAAEGLAVLRDEARARGLAIDIAEGLMTSLPYADAAFDYVLSLNVIYHGDGNVVRAAIGEIRRVLKPGGIFQGTMLSKRNSAYRAGREVAPDTWINPGDEDKDHPHFYCDAAGLVALFQGFELFELADRIYDTPGSWHWYLIAERLP